jgi:hypothetical protein
MTLAILGAIADSPLIADLLAGAGLGSLVGFAVAERMRGRGWSESQVHALPPRWATFCAIIALVLHTIQWLT